MLIFQEGREKYIVKYIKVSKGIKIRNRYSQVPHLTQDTNGKVTNSQLYTTSESQEVSPFPAVYNFMKISQNNCLLKLSDAFCVMFRRSAESISQKDNCLNYPASTHIRATNGPPVIRHSMAYRWRAVGGPLLCASWVYLSSC